MPLLPDPLRHLVERHERVLFGEHEVGPAGGGDDHLAGRHGTVDRQLGLRRLRLDADEALGIDRVLADQLERGGALLTLLTLLALLSLLSLLPLLPLGTLGTLGT